MDLLATIVAVLLGFAVALWGVRFVIMIRALRGDSFLPGGAPCPLPDDPPLVSIIIPARNEEEHLAGCLDGLLAQDYARFEIIVANDRSEDRTGEIARSYAAEHDAVRVVEASEPPAGWTGKTNALATAVGHARGEWLLFVDGDTRHTPENLRITMGYALAHAVDMLSLLCRVIPRTFWDRALQPLCGAVLMAYYRLPRINDPARRLAFANGQYILIRRSAYDQVGGHAAVKDRLLEDIALARLVKGAGLRLHVAWGLDIAGTHFYTTLKDIFRGWSRLYLAGFDDRRWILPVGLVLVTLTCILPLVAFLVAGALLLAGAGGGILWAVFVLGLTAVALYHAVFAAIYAHSRVGVAWSFFIPVGVFFLWAVLCYTVWRGSGGRAITWRGRAYAPGT